MNLLVSAIALATLSNCGKVLRYPQNKVTSCGFEQSAANGSFQETKVQRLNGSGCLVYTHNTQDIVYPQQLLSIEYSDWLQIWNELTQTAGHQLGYANMVGNIPSLVSPTENKSGSAVTVKGKTLYIPLQFWFNSIGSEQ